MSDDKKIKVIITKVGLDGHDRGAKVVVSLLKEAGMEVVYLGMFNQIEDIIQAVIDEDADVLGLSYLSGEQLIFTPKIVEEMKKNNLDDVLLIVGGTVPVEDIPMMEDMGVDRVFRAGSLSSEFVDYIEKNVRK
ncbi:MAG: cobalamin B12-binding domain-containing protein [Deltaproteobacteria bacterium]|nr:cobalamin B12-binding domain-containing protein [Deltaproteobacteria bacterium]